MASYMRVVGLTIKINGDASGLSGALGKVGLECDKLGRQIQSVGRSIERTGQSLTRNLTVPIVTAFTAAIKTAADFETSIAKVDAITASAAKSEEEHAENMQRLTEGIRGLAQETKFTASETADAAYYMAMAGWEVDEIYSGLPGVLALAAASGEDLATTSDIVTDAMTAFGLTAEEAGHFADVLAQTSASANTNVGLLGESFKYVAPVAGALHYSIEDVSLALGLMANNGIKGSMAGTSLRNILQRMVKPTKDSEEAMKRLGLTEEKIASLSLADVMTELRDAFKDLADPSEEFIEQMNDLAEQLEDGQISEEEYEQTLNDLATAEYGAANAEKVRLAAMLAGARGMPGLLAIVNAAEEDYGKLAAAISESDGVAQTMAQTMQDTLAGQLQILVSQLQELAIQVGEIVIPKIREFVTMLQGWVTALQQMDPEQKEQILQIAAIVAAIGPALVIGGKVITLIGSIVSSFGKLNGVLSLLATPIGWVVLLVAGMVASFLHLLKTNEEFRNDMIAIWEDLKATWDQVSQDIVDALNDMGFEFEDIGDVIRTIVEGLAKFLGYTVGGAVKDTAREVKTGMNNVSNIMKMAAAIMKGDWSSAWEALLNMATNKLNNMSSKVGTYANNIWGSIEWIGKKLKGESWSLPKLKMPHFSVTWGESFWGVSLPRIHVEWYKKAYNTPYLFTDPTVVNGKGFGDGGGSGEIVYGRDQLMRDIAQASMGEITINIYANNNMNVNQLADKVQERLVQLQQQRISAYA